MNVVHIVSIQVITYWWCLAQIFVSLNPETIGILNNNLTLLYIFPCIVLYYLAGLFYADNTSIWFISFTLPLFFFQIHLSSNFWTIDWERQLVWRRFSKLGLPTSCTRHWSNALRYSDYKSIERNCSVKYVNKKCKWFQQQSISIKVFTKTRCGFGDN